MRISINQWRLLDAAEQENYTYVSNAEGCYFESKKEENQSEDVIDDFERLMKGD